MPELKKDMMFSSIPKKPLKVILVMLLIGIIFTAGFTVGQRQSDASGRLNLSKFWQTYSIILSKYPGTFDKTKAEDGATKGLVESLGDPYSAFLEPSQKQDLTDELNGSFQGVGAELTVKNSLITVVTALSETPAEAAGIKANDVVLKIDGQSTEKMSLNDAVSKIRGPKDTQVTLTIGRSDVAPIDIKITRAAIQVKSVTWKMIDKVGYIEIRQFGNDTADLAKQATNELSQKNPKAMIIDLRNNPGGYLNSVAPITGLFLPPSVTVKEKYKDGRSDEIRSVTVPVMPTTPIYILVNGGTASAAEILAGAMQDYKRATLIGAKTYGKGSVQDIFDLTNNYALRLTIAEWLTPNGRSINKQGIEPDVAVDGDKTNATDPVLDKALQLAKTP